MKKSRKVTLECVLSMCFIGVGILGIIYQFKPDQNDDDIVNTYQETVSYKILAETYDVSDHSAEVEVTLPNLQAIYEAIALEHDLSSISDDQFFQLVENQMKNYLMQVQIRTEVTQTEEGYSLVSEDKLKELEYAQLDKWFSSILSQELGNLEIIVNKETME